MQFSADWFWDRSPLAALILTGVTCLVLCSPTLAVAHGEHGASHTHPDIVRTIREHARKVSVACQPGIVEATQTLHYEMTDPRREVIDFFPGALAPNRGVDLGLMLQDGRVATNALLLTVLSHEGYLQVHAIMGLEDVLRGMDPYSSIRDSGNYAISIYGDLEGSAPWGWKFEGHHLSLNITVSNDQVRTTPVFLGVNPAEVRGGAKTGLRAMAPHQDRAFLLLESLDESQIVAALSPLPVAEEVVERGGAMTPPGDHGLSVAEMTEAQRETLLSVIAAYARLMRGELADDEMERVRRAGVENLRFQWRGSQLPGERHYYRIDGPTVVIEFDAIVDDPDVGANHIHAIWRDPTRDFGQDLLRQHYEDAHQEKSGGG